MNIRNRILIGSRIGKNQWSCGFVIELIHIHGFGENNLIFGIDFLCWWIQIYIIKKSLK